MVSVEFPFTDMQGRKRRPGVVLVASLGLLHPQILSLEAVPFKGGRSEMVWGSSARSC